MPRYSNSSLYARTEQNSVGLDILNYRQIPAKLGDKLYELKPQYNYRPDLLASDLFDNPDLWWMEEEPLLIFPDCMRPIETTEGEENDN